MADVFSPAKRSRVMSLIRSKDTKAEKIVFRYLRQNKVYFQKHYKRATGTPDIALPRQKKAVFVDSDFWHGRTYAKVVKDRKPDDYWVVKIANNIERDKRVRKELIDNGWRILVVWEEDIKRLRTRESVLTEVKEFLKK